MIQLKIQLKTKLINKQIGSYFSVSIDRNAHSISTRRDKIIALIMIILAVLTSVIAISTNLYNAFSSKS